MIVEEFGMDRYTLLHLKWVSTLMHSSGNSAQCRVAASTGGGVKKEYTCV